MNDTAQDLKPHGKRNTLRIAERSIDDRPLADAHAPLIRNAWYVVAESADIGRALTPVTALEEPLVVYRDTAGDVVVLDDRCPHRRYPLSRGALVDDTIQCGYHGFKYDGTGACVWAPTLKNKPGFGVRKYPSVEKGPWVWAYFGDPEEADETTIPYFEKEEGIEWRSRQGYKFNPCNYMLLIENFLDLTHFYFLHGKHVLTTEDADVPLKSLDAGENGVGWIKKVGGGKTGLFGKLAGRDHDEIVDLEGTAVQIGPSMHIGKEIRRLPDGKHDDAYPIYVLMNHAITPKTLHETHQFTEFCLSFDPIGGMDKFRDFSRDVVFEEDVEALGLINDYIVQDRRPGEVEFGIPGDRFGIRMRQILRKLKDKESPQDG